MTLHKDIECFRGLRLTFTHCILIFLISKDIQLLKHKTESDFNQFNI